MTTKRNERGQFMSRAEQIEDIKAKAVADGLVLLNDTKGMPSPVVRRLWAWNTLEAAAIQIEHLQNA